MTEELALFPLGSVLMPNGRLALQIFEQRYLELIKAHLRDERAFGIVQLRSGGEVSRPGTPDIKLAEMGCVARVVDWDQLPNNLLGITVQGEQRFVLRECWQADNALWLGAVEYLPDDEPLPLPEEASDLLALMSRLTEHPHVKRLGVEIDDSDAGVLANQLGQLLPIPEEARYELLEALDPLERLDLLQQMLDRFV